METFNMLLLQLDEELHAGKCNYNKMLAALSEWLAEDKEATVEQRSKAIDIALALNSIIEQQTTLIGKIIKAKED